MAIANISLGTTPSSATATITTTRLWQLLGTVPAYNLGTGSKTLIEQLNSALYDIRSGTTVLPRTITMVNGQPKSLTAGNLILSLTDIPDATSNIFIRTNFSNNSVLNTRLNAVNAAIVTANLAMKTYVDARVTANLAANVVQTVTDSLNSGNLLAPIYSNVTALTSNVTTLFGNATTQAVQVAVINANLGAFQTYSNTIQATFGAFQTYANATFSGGTYGNTNVATYLPTNPTWVGYLASANANAAAQTTSINAVSSAAGEYQTYANTAIGTIQANLGAYQTYANANALTQATSINAVNANVTVANARIVSIDANIGTLLSGILNPLSGDNISTKANLGTATLNISSLQANMSAANALVSSLSSTVGTFAANISTLLSNAGAQGSTLSNLSANAATQATSINVIEANLGTIATTVNGLLLSNAGIQATTLANLTANAVIQHGNIRYLDANLGTATTNISLGVTESNALRANITAANLAVTNYISTNNANIGAYQTWANANIVGITSNLTTLFGNALTQAAQIGALDTNTNAFYTYANLVTANLSANVGAFYTYANATFSGGTYGNTNVALYLPTNPTWTGYLTAANANAASQATGINTINANLGAYQTTVNASLQTINANVGAFHAYANANAVTQNTSINTINANLGAYQTFANANAVTQNTSINTINANLGAYQTYANLTFGAGSFGNANVFVYLNSYNGNLYASNLATTGKITTTGGIFWANGTAYSTGSGPAFIAEISSGQGLPTSPLSLTQFSLIYNSVSKNIGNGYNASTGIFTAPRAGFYQVSASCAVSPANVTRVLNYYGEAVLGIYRNNIPVAAGGFIDARGAIILGIPVGAFSASSTSPMIYLNVGDTLQCKLGYISNAPTNFWNTYANAVPNYFQACWLRE